MSLAVRSNAGMANRQGDIDLLFAQVSAPQLAIWLGLAIALPTKIMYVFFISFMHATCPVWVIPLDFIVQKMLGEEH